MVFAQGESRSDFRSPILADGYEVDIAGKYTTDAGLARVHFRDLSPLRTLNLSSTEITDNGLKPLQGLSDLMALDLSRSDVGDAGLAQLKGLTQLRWLNLRDTRVTDAGLTHLKALPQLQWLDLTNTKVSPAGLQHVKCLTQLERLYLPGSTGIRDDGVDNLRQTLPNCVTELRPWRPDAKIKESVGRELEYLERRFDLRSIDISNSRVTDDDLRHVKEMPQLRWIDLSNTNVSDEGLEHLVGLTRLRELHLNGSRCTPEGIKKLQQALPKCEIIWKPPVTGDGQCPPPTASPGH